MKKKTLLALFVFTLTVSLFNACKSKKTLKDYEYQPTEIANQQIVPVAFYNLENLFDTINQANRDEQFLPTSSLKWTGAKYKSKLNNMAYAISQIGLGIQPTGVSVLGVAEVENRGVLEELVKQPQIAQRGYKIIHFDSPDKRGIDVGLLYNPHHFTPTATKTYAVKLKNKNHPTRDILVVSGSLFNEKIHFLVNHWPSRYGGLKKSIPNRKRAAYKTKHIVDSLYKVDANAKIVVMGDLNDDPTDASVAKVLKARKEKKDLSAEGLYNPFWKIYESGIGSLSYRGVWFLFDQIIFSTPLVNELDASKFRFWKAEVFNKSFLTQQKGKYRGTPLRTHGGGVWLNGYSDHFPTIIYLTKEKK